MRIVEGRYRRGALSLLVGAAVVLVSACSGASGTSTASTAVARPTTPTAVVASPPASGATPVTVAPPVAAPTVAATKVSANSATIPQLQATFEAAGITNAARWAREVDEYRPYATSDTNFAKLRGELAKYNPAPGVVDAIVGTLTLP